MWGRIGLIGDTGYVGGTLMSSITFDRTYNSRTIEGIVDESFDTLVCAGAPATMWAANANPNADLANLERLACALDSARTNRVVLISTIAVLDNLSAGYTESTARYETKLAYGRNRRALEERVLASPGAVVLRLPALFGTGLRKNFIFDLMNPIPSFIRCAKFAEVRDKLTTKEKSIVDTVFSLDTKLGILKLDRAGLEVGGQRTILEQAFAREGCLASSFTNSASRYQFYNLKNLKCDIATSLASGIRILNVCSEPWGAAELHMALLGSTFSNDGPPVVGEDMRSEHAATFGRRGTYLYDRCEVLSDLKSLFAMRGS